MNAEALVKLIEELIDLKVQQTAQPHHKLSPEVARMLEQKRFTDRQRLQQIRTELVQMLGANGLQTVGSETLSRRR
jgi:hypothetical protein